MSGPAELLTVLPFHLGFRPERSVVVACFHGVRLGLVARLDLVAPTDALRAAEETVPALVRERPSRVVLVGFAAPSDATVEPVGTGEPLVTGDPRPLLDALRLRLDDAGVTVSERLLVRDGRWFGLDCDCCPSPGLPLPDAADVPAVAEYVAIGTAVLESREQLAALVEPLPTDDAHHDARLAAVQGWVQEWAGQRSRGALVDEGLGAWVRLARHGLDAEPTPRAVAALVGPLVDLGVRDVVVSWLSRGGFPGDHVPDDLATGLQRALDAQDVVEERAAAGSAIPAETDAETDAEAGRFVLAHVEQLCRATPEACAAPVLAVAAAYAWWLGDGARASFAADRALRAEPGHGLATLVRAALEVGVRPPRCA